MINRQGYRGYVGSRTYPCGRAPQHVQNLVIRDYCQRQGLLYLLSATEYAMPDCHLILEQLMDELPSLEGVVLYSIFMLPAERRHRRTIYQRVIDSGAVLCGAVEGYRIADRQDIERVETVWLLDQSVPGPWRGKDKIGK